MSIYMGILILRFVLAVTAFALSGASWLFWGMAKEDKLDELFQDMYYVEKGISIVLVFFSIALWWLFFAV